MSITVTIVNAFPKGPVGGNPAGIVLDLEGRIPAPLRQAIAARMSLSETAFISRPKAVGADYRLEFFTPTRQIAHCGHATIAAFNFLAQRHGAHGVLVKETIETPRKITLRSGKAFMEQLGPRYESPAVPMERIARALGGPAGKTEVASTGNRFLLIEVPDLGALKALRPDLRELEAISAERDLIGFYAFAVGSTGVAAYARMFAPRFGIAEESATGMAAGPLACLLRDHFGIKNRSFVIGQGDHMPEPSPSRIEVELSLDERGEIEGLVVGGAGRIVKTVEINAEEL